MSPIIIEAIAPLFAMLSIGTFVLIGMKMRLNAKVRLQESGQSGDNGDSGRLTEAIEMLHDEVRAMRGDVVDLQERVDFAERLLTRGKDHANYALEEGASTPV